MELKLPSDWSEVSVDKYIQLKSVELTDFSTHLSFQMDRLFILTDTDIDSEIWDVTPADELTETIKKLEWLNTPPSIHFKKQIGEYTYKESLTLGEFIDLEYLCGINYIEKLPNICAILYRKTTLNEWGHTIIEPRGYNESERAKSFLELPINDIYGILPMYLNLKKKVLDAYGNMLNDIETEEPEEVHPEDKAEVEKEKIANKWAWERAIHLYSQKSNLTFKEVTNLPLIFFMNQLAMFHDLKI